MKEKKSWQEWRTTLVGALTIIGSALVLFGVIGAEENAELQTHTIGFLDAIGAGIIAISGVINIFRAK